MKTPIKFYRSCIENYLDDSFLKFLQLTDSSLPSVLNYFISLYSKLPETIGSNKANIGLFRYHVDYDWKLSGTSDKATYTVSVKIDPYV